MPRVLALAFGLAVEVAGRLTGREPMVSTSSVRWSISPLEPAITRRARVGRAHGMLA
jgi:hypothetical protein